MLSSQKRPLPEQSDAFKEYTQNTKRPRPAAETPTTIPASIRVIISDLPACIEKSSLEKILTVQGFESSKIKIDRTISFDGSVKTQGIITFSTLEKANSWIKMNEVNKALKSLKNFFRET